MFTSIRHVWEMPRLCARGARDVIINIPAQRTIV